MAPEKKPAFTFFLLIVFLLTGENQSVHASASMVKSQVSDNASIKNILQSEESFNQQAIFQSNGSGTEKQNDPIVFVADEDENENVTRKSTSQSVSIVTCFYSIVASNNRNNSANTFAAYKLPSFSGSCIYIEQCSLRI